MTQTQTYGESTVNKLLDRLIKANPSEYFFIPEPKIMGQNGSVSPDFVIVSAKRGVYVVEVKDWVEFVPSGCNQKKVTVRRRDGTVEPHDNPVLTALNYAHALSDRLQQKKELLHKYDEEIKLKFPWQEIVILPNISKKEIQAFYDSGIWFPGTVLGREDLTDVAALEAALNNVKMKFKINGMDSATLNIIRAVVDPTLEVGNGGIETIQQEKIIREQLPLFGDNILTDEAKAVATDQHIRLVRGVAGSGKTLVLLRRAYYLQAMMPQLKILIMVFNRDLMEDTRRRVDDPDIEVINFHTMCSQVFKDAKKKWPQPTDARGWLEHDTESRTLLQQHNFDVDFVVSEIQWRKEARLINIDDYLAADRRGRVKSLQRTKREAIDQIFQRYLQHQTRLKNSNHDWEDWEDIPQITLELLQNPKHPKYQAYDVIMIDEGQDFAPAWLGSVDIW